MFKIVVMVIEKALGVLWLDFIVTVVFLGFLQVVLVLLKMVRVLFYG